VLVAGDVFDDVRPPQRLIGQTLARLAKYPNLVWHFISGNHDPVVPGSVWDDVARLAPGSHIRLHLSAEAVEIAPNVLLLPAPLTARAMSHDPTAFMDRVESVPGMIRVGMAHGSVRGFSSEGEAAIPILMERAASARLDYFALGDWHGAIRINPRTWYAGTPEADRFRDNDAGHVLVVSIAAAGSTPVVEKAATGQFQWHQQTLEITSAAQVDALAETLRKGDVPQERILLKLAVRGRLPLAEGSGLEASLESLAAAVAHLSVDRDGVVLSTEAADIEALGTGAIAMVAAQLAEQIRAGDGRQQAIAGRALQLLTRYAGTAS
jgi:DNA repair exonuclease SbcCD nuclease subunit